MLIRFLHWVAKDVLPDKVWVRWLRWRYQRENRPRRKRGDVCDYSASSAYAQQRDAARRNYERLWHEAIPLMREAHDPVHDHPFVPYPPTPGGGAPSNCLTCGWPPKSPASKGYVRQPEVYDCGCPVELSPSGNYGWQHHAEECEHYRPFRKGGIIGPPGRGLPHDATECTCSECEESRDVVASLKRSLRSDYIPLVIHDTHDRPRQNSVRPNPSISYRQ